MSEGSRRRRSFLAAAVMALAPLGALGCEAREAVPPRAPLAAPLPPTPPQYITGMPPRNVGTLRPATEQELALVKKKLPFGALVHEMYSVDSDTVARLTGERVVDVRAVEHEHRIKTVRLVGPTREGMLRSLVTYLNDVDQKVEQGRVVSRPSAVHGRSYVVDVGPGGVRVFTTEGYTPTPVEVQIVQQDYDKHRRTRPADEPLRRTARDLPPPVPSPVAAVTADLRRQMEDAGITVYDLRVAVRGIREVDGVPCAVFGVTVRGHKDESQDGTTVRAAVDLSGEYSVRLEDGWDAELILEGLRRVSGAVRVRGTAVAVDSIGRLRVLGFSRYDLTAVGGQRTLESLDRAPGPTGKP